MVAEYSSSIKPEHEHQASVCLDLSLHDKYDTPVWQEFKKQCYVTCLIFYYILHW